MRLERLVAEDTYRPTSKGTTLVGNRPVAAQHIQARGNAPAPLQDWQGSFWLTVDRSRPRRVGDGLQRLPQCGHFFFRAGFFLRWLLQYGQTASVLPTA